MMPLLFGFFEIFISYFISGWHDFRLIEVISTYLISTIYIHILELIRLWVQCFI
jgi:hypothetical protein